MIALESHFSVSYGKTVSFCFIRITRAEAIGRFPVRKNDPLRVTEFQKNFKLDTFSRATARKEYSVIRAC